MNVFKRIWTAIVDKRAAIEWAGIRKARKYQIDSKKIEWAFSVENKKTGQIKNYYRFKDPLDRPPLRHSSWVVKFEELRMGVTREFLFDWIKFALNDLDGGPNGQIKLSDIHAKIHDLKARLLLAPFEDHIYALASVEFFTLDETINDYIFNEQNEKIEFWKNSEDATAFFLRKPVAELIGFDNSSRKDLERHLKKGRDELKRQQIIFSLLNNEEKS